MEGSPEKAAMEGQLKSLTDQLAAEPVTKLLTKLQKSVYGHVNRDAAMILLKLEEDSSGEAGFGAIMQVTESCEICRIRTEPYLILYRHGR